VSNGFTWPVKLAAHERRHAERDGEHGDVEVGVGREELGHRGHVPGSAARPRSTSRETARRLSSSVVIATASPPPIHQRTAAKAADAA